MKRNRRHDRHLAPCVKSFHIRSRVSLGISQILRLFQRVVKFHTVLKHLGQDIVGRAVYDAQHI